MRLTRSLPLAFVLSFGLAASAAAQSQEPPRLEIGLLPGGVTFFTPDNGLPEFFTYATAGSVTLNLNRYFGLEGEIGGQFGVDQSINFNPASFGTIDARPPHALSYSGGVVVHPWGRDRRTGVFLTAGAGGLTLFERAEVGVAEDKTLFTVHAGAGVRYDVSDRWGLRLDYRVITLPSTDDAPALIGPDVRVAHRIAGGLAFSFGR